MKIVAYSRIPSSTPFVHLGYLAASTTTTKPIQGLLFGGIVVLLAGFALIGGGLVRQRNSAEPSKARGLHAYKLGDIGIALLLLSIAIIGSAYAFGERDRVFHHPEIATWDHIENFKQTVASRSKPDSSAGSVAGLPTQKGEYDLSSVLNLPARQRERCTDGWNRPLILRVTQHEDQVEYLIVSAGPDRTMGTPDDVTSLDPYPK